MGHYGTLWVWHSYYGLLWEKSELADEVIQIDRVKQVVSTQWDPGLAYETVWPKGHVMWQIISLMSLMGMLCKCVLDAGHFLQSWPEPRCVQLGQSSKLLLLLLFLSFSRPFRAHPIAVFTYQSIYLGPFCPFLAPVLAPQTACPGQSLPLRSDSLSCLELWGCYERTFILSFSILSYLITDYLI